MLDLYRKQMGCVIIAIAAPGSAVMYWNHVNRAVNDPRLCTDLERHVYKLARMPDGSTNAELENMSQTIGDQCASKFSKSYARCLLKSGSLPELRAC